MNLDKFSLQPQVRRNKMSALTKKEYFEITHNLDFEKFKKKYKKPWIAIYINHLRINELEKKIQACISKETPT